ncbi:unnamed protein product, partial [Closterium sp. NIES-53]
VYHPTSRCVLSSQDVTFDESVSYYRLFPYRTASLPPPPRPSSWHLVAVDCGAARGAEPERAESGGPPRAAGPTRRAAGGASGARAAGGAAGARAAGAAGPG